MDGDSFSPIVCVVCCLVYQTASVMLLQLVSAMKESVTVLKSSILLLFFLYVM